ncbi:multidrug effflux MFS transporter [Halioxenophilus aromaticivorans]|uniref:Bcr/CflA family efflux transporter n=1 Tax=Halioxenophilus aromaticivorans TaxID=1306992 RepID=A0AAV3U509_9ALTE
MTTNTSTTQPAIGISTAAFTLILASLMAFTSLSTDVYLPAMPTMEQELHGSIELTVTSFLVGFMLAQLVWGPISDRIGRKRPLAIGIGLFIIGSVGCALSETLNQMIVWRVIQAFGACTGPMIARAMVRDSFDRTQSAHMMSTLMIVMAAAPILGPVIGGQLIAFSSWHSIFWFLALIGVVNLVSITKLPETLPEPQRVTAPISSAFGHYVTLLKNGRFMAYTFCVASFYVGAFAFIVGSPKVYIDHYSVSPQLYGWLFGINVVGLMLVSFANRRLVKRFSLETLLVAATFIAFAAVAALFIINQIHEVPLLGIICLALIFFAMNGIIAACTTAAALDLVPHMAGSASALIGALQYGSGILSSALLALGPSHSPKAMIWIMTAAALMSLVMALAVNRKPVAQN